MEREESRTHEEDEEGEGGGNGAGVCASHMGTMHANARTRTRARDGRARQYSITGESKSALTCGSDQWLTMLPEDVLRSKGGGEKLAALPMTTLSASGVSEQTYDACRQNRFAEATRHERDSSALCDTARREQDAILFALQVLNRKEGLLCANVLQQTRQRKGKPGQSLTTAHVHVRACAGEPNRRAAPHTHIHFFVSLIPLLKLHVAGRRMRTTVMMMRRREGGDQRQCAGSVGERASSSTQTQQGDCRSQRQCTKKRVRERF